MKEKVETNKVYVKLIRDFMHDVKKMAEEEGSKEVFLLRQTHMKKFNDIARIRIEMLNKHVFLFR